MKELRVIIHGEEHIFHAHDVDDILGGTKVKGMAYNPGRQYIAEQLPKLGLPLPGPIRVHAVSRFPQLVEILLKVGDLCVEMVPEVLPLGIQSVLGCYRQAEGHEACRYSHRQICRYHRVVPKEGMVHHAPAQFPLKLPGLLTLTLHKAGYYVPREGAKLYSDHGTAAQFKGTVGLPLLPQVAHFGAQRKFLLLFYQVPEYL